MRMPKLVKLTARDDWHCVLANSQLVYGTPERPKVCRTQDGFMIKWFYPRGGVSSDLIFPYAKRFIRHSLQLEQKGIESVHVQAWLYDPQSNAHIVIYPELKGITVRTAMTSDLADVVMDQFIDFIVECHERGVFFRGIHLANVLVREVEVPRKNHDTLTRDEGIQLAFSLIDVTDCKIKHSKLNRWERVRNIKHMLMNAEDYPCYAEYGVQRFIDRYIELTGVEMEVSATKRSGVVSRQNANQVEYAEQLEETT